MPASSRRSTGARRRAWWTRSATDVTGVAAGRRGLRLRRRRRGGRVRRAGRLRAQARGPLVGGGRRAARGGRDQRARVQRARRRARGADDRDQRRGRRRRHRRRAAGRARGARVIGTASERNHDFLRSLGAEPTTYGEGLVERVRALAPDGVDLAFDTAGQGRHARPHHADRRPGARGHDRRLLRRGARREGDRRRGGPRAGALDEAAGLRRGRPPLACRSRRRSPSPGGRRAPGSQGGHVRGKLVLVP